MPEPTDSSAQVAEETPASVTPVEESLVEESLVEEVSIDGMCGVY